MVDRSRKMVPGDGSSSSKVLSVLPQWFLLDEQLAGGVRTTVRAGPLLLLDALWSALLLPWFLCWEPVWVPQLLWVTPLRVTGIW